MRRQMLLCMTVRHAALLDLVGMLTAEAAQTKQICRNGFINGCALQISKGGDTDAFTTRDGGPFNTHSNKGVVKQLLQPASQTAHVRACFHEATSEDPVPKLLHLLQRMGSESLTTARVGMGCLRSVARL